MYDASLVGLTCLFHAFSAGACWRARRVAGLRTARCAASCADLCAVSCAARSAEPSEAVCSLLKKERKKRFSPEFREIADNCNHYLLQQFLEICEKMVQKFFLLFF